MITLFFLFYHISKSWDDLPSWRLQLQKGHECGSSPYLEDHPKVVIISPIYKPFRPFGRGTALPRGLAITMVINHLLEWDDPPSNQNTLWGCLCWDPLSHLPRRPFGGSKHLLTKHFDDFGNVFLIPSATLCLVSDFSEIMLSKFQPKFRNTNPGSSMWPFGMVSSREPLEACWWPPTKESISVSNWITW